MTYKVLTVDDSRTIRMIVKKAFQPYDCELFEAENGSEGLAAAAKLLPDLIVLDITMPVMNGIEMLTRLKKDDALKEIPVIMLSAESGKEHVMQIVKMGVKDYIVKPFKGAQLIDRASQVLNLGNPDAPDPADAGSTPGDYFIEEGDWVILRFPKKITRSAAARIDTAVKKKIGGMIETSKNRLIIDLSPTSNVNMNAIQVIIALTDLCIGNKISARIVATDEQSAALKGFQETSSFATQPSIEHAMAAF